ncbi:MAG: hypothetical protein R3275_03300 [Saprospiraceae bacterium]|nr:hypothetical protein [Saprospiraceae bacterium]
MAKLLFTFLGLILLFGTVSGQGSPESLINQFFTDYKNVPPDQALHNLYASMPSPERIEKEVNELKRKFSNLKSLVGDYHGHDLIAKKELAGCFSIHSYLVRFELQPVRFIFEFYKPNKSWGLYGFSYDDNIDDELEEVVKVQNILDSD